MANFSLPAPPGFYGPITRRDALGLDISQEIQLISKRNIGDDVCFPWTLNLPTGADVELGCPPAIGAASSVEPDEELFLSHEQCRAHSTFWITIMIIVMISKVLKTEPLLSWRKSRGPHRSLAIPSDRKKRIQAARREDLSIRVARLLQWLLLALLIILDDSLCANGRQSATERISLILSKYKKEAVFIRISLILFVRPILSSLWEILRLRLWPLLRFGSRTIGIQFRYFPVSPSDAEILIRKIIHLSTIPTLGFLLTWPDDELWLESPLTPVPFLLLAILYSPSDSDEFKDWQISKIENSFDHTGVCVICGQVDEEFDDRITDWAIRNRHIEDEAEKGTSIGPIADFWLCSQCAGSD